MSRFSSIITPKKLSLVAYPDDYQIANLQIKLPAMLEYLYVINESITKDDLQNKQGEFTKNKYEIVLQNDGSLIIHSDATLQWYVCAFLNEKEIDFKLTQLQYEQTIKTGSKESEEVQYVFHYEQSHLSTKITKESLFEALQDKSDIKSLNDNMEFELMFTNSFIDSLKETDYKMLQEEHDIEFIAY
jgi:hypothetical protein